jgi:hypothetical protein
MPAKFHKDNLNNEEHSDIKTLRTNKNDLNSVSEDWNKQESHLYCKLQMNLRKVNNLQPVSYNTAQQIFSKSST